ncbi:unnamed protein product [Calicophoron daubneyi]|uniref:Uncharacterized protein n=1 Tax=Calicophoron daubneyi TaxID=300641 RepID=A0AAV2TAU7_CALDB
MHLKVRHPEANLRIVLLAHKGKRFSRHDYLEFESGIGSIHQLDGLEYHCLCLDFGKLWPLEPNCSNRIPGNHRLMLYRSTMLQSQRYFYGLKNVALTNY